MEINEYQEKAKRTMKKLGNLQLDLEHMFPSHDKPCNVT